MRNNVKKQLVKWTIAAGATLSVALLFQQARSSDAFTAGSDRPSVSEAVGADNAIDDPLAVEEPSANGNGLFDDTFRSPASSEQGNDGGFRSRSRQS
ncbi:hypothetical protein ACFPPD_15650 [Cohnella suwonensis]|uniref:Uncharacterized protein n=1 Tax=Cohnella suwonensis TaxID=696072 RepID=A0ABW0LYY8_9BACL